MTTRSFLTRLAATSVFAVTIAVPAPVVAQEATPSTGAEVVACTVEPRDPDVLVGFYFDEQGTPMATPAPTSRPRSTPSWPSCSSASTSDNTLAASL